MTLTCLSCLRYKIQADVKQTPAHCQICGCTMLFRNRVRTVDQLRDMAADGGNATVERHGTEHMRRAGRKGGIAKLEIYGREVFRQMGLKSAEKRKGKRNG